MRGLRGYRSEWFKRDRERERERERTEWSMEGTEGQWVAESPSERRVIVALPYIHT